MDTSVDTNTTWASEAVRRIENDLTDRRGLKHEWNNIDEDVRDEIRGTWSRIIMEASDGASRINPEDEAETDRFLTALGTTYREELARKIADEVNYDNNPNRIGLWERVYKAALFVLGTE